MSKTYENVQQLLNRMLYDKLLRAWRLQNTWTTGGFTEFSCFLYLWDSRADSEHCAKVKLPPKYLNSRKAQYYWKCSCKVLLPSFRIKLGLVKQVVKAFDVESEAFKFEKSFKTL